MSRICAIKGIMGNYSWSMLQILKQLPGSLVGFQQIARFTSFIVGVSKHI
jgi:hypothetical protein